MTRLRSREDCDAREAGLRPRLFFAGLATPTRGLTAALVEFCGGLTDAAGRLECRHERVTSQYEPYLIDGRRDLSLNLFQGNS